MIPKLKILLLFAFFNFKLVYLQNIKAILNETIQKESSCKSTLLLNERFVLQGLVEFDKLPEESYGFINIEWTMKHDNASHLFDTVFLNCCNCSESFYCTKKENKNEYKLVLNTSAQKEFSSSEWSLVGHQFNSNKIRFLEVLNVSETILSLNDIVVTKNLTTFTTTTDELKLCCRNSEEPC
ncbi:uncharacterized protein LOC129922875 isoform X2 [Biomphalaria glabrata]|nr:uncharacterized protein LOC129922875 isoform X2 [Biomphalaria glabrata]